MIRAQGAQLPGHGTQPLRAVCRGQVAQRPERGRRRRRFLAPRGAISGRRRRPYWRPSVENGVQRLLTRYSESRSLHASNRRGVDNGHGAAFIIAAAPAGRGRENRSTLAAAFERVAFMAQGCHGVGAPKEWRWPRRALGRAGHGAGLRPHPGFAGASSRESCQRHWPGADCRPAILS
jgi:hypothetical protein